MLFQTSLADYVNTGQVAEMLQVDPQTVRMWVKDNKLPTPVRLGRRMLWRREVIQRHLDNLLLSQEHSRQ